MDGISNLSYTFIIVVDLIKSTEAKASFGSFSTNLFGFGMYLGLYLYITVV